MLVLSLLPKSNMFCVRACDKIVALEVLQNASSEKVRENATGALWILQKDQEQSGRTSTKPGSYSVHYTAGRLEKIISTQSYLYEFFNLLVDSTVFASVLQAHEMRRLITLKTDSTPVQNNQRRTESDHIRTYCSC